MTETAIKELCFQKINTEDNLYYYSFSVAGIDFVSNGKDQSDDKQWYVDFICPNTLKPSIRFYSADDVKHVIKIITKNKI